MPAGGYALAVEATLAFLLLLTLAGVVVFGLMWLSERNARISFQRRLGETDYAARAALGQRDAGLWQAQAAGRAATSNLVEAKGLLVEASRRIESLSAELKTTIREREQLARGAQKEIEKRDSRIAMLERQVAASDLMSAELSRDLKTARQDEHVVGVQASTLTKHLDAIAARYIDDALKWVISRITPNNLETSRVRFEKVVTFCQKHTYVLDADAAKACDAEIVAAFKDAVQKDEARQQQQRIKEQIREEQRAEAEYRRAQEQASKDETRLHEALAKALKQTNDAHSAEVAALQAQLTALQEKKRALSMAQQTRAGHIYVISNLGSFGAGVYKVGMTRRLEPLDRVVELGDASVPFPFDVHMMISCNDAPGLENALHRALHVKRLNKVNLRKEFFRTTLDEIVALVKAHHGHVDYRAEPDAFEFHETRAIEERGAFAPFVEPSRDEQIAEQAETN